MLFSAHSTLWFSVTTVRFSICMCKIEGEYVDLSNSFRFLVDSHQRAEKALKHLLLYLIYLLLVGTILEIVRPIM